LLTFIFILFLTLTNATLATEIDYSNVSEEAFDEELFLDDFILNDDEPRRPQVRRVRIIGNRAFSNVVLREIIATKQPGVIRRMQFWKPDEFDLSEQEIRRDVIRMQRFYERRGFYETQITYQIEEGKRSHHQIVTFNISEGEPVKVRSLDYSFITDDPKMEQEIRESRTFRRANTGIRNPFLKGNRYELIKHGDMEAQLRRRLQNRGHAFVRVEADAVIDTLARKADVHITIEPGPVAWFNTILVEGAETVPPSLVEYQSDIRTGDQFSRNKLRRGQQLLFRHPLFRFVTVNLPEQPVSDSVDVRIRVREFPLRSIQIQAGLGDEEIIRGRVSWTHRNPFGNGHRFSVSARGSFIEQRAGLDYLMPGLFTPRSNFNISPFILRLDEKNFLLNSGGIRSNLGYYHNEYFVANLGYEWSQNKIFQKDLNVVVRDSTVIYNISSLTLSALYNESTPSRGRGWAFRPYIEFSGFLNTGTIAYNKLVLDVRRFIDVSSSTQLALRLDNGFLFSNQPFSTPANIRFYAGGTNSVRGWSRSQLGPKRAILDEQGNFRDFVPVGGRALSMFNVELRQDLPLFENGLMFVAFLDGGQVWLDYQDFNPADYQYAAGGGFRYLSPIGPIRIDFGYKLNPRDSDLNIFEGVRYGGVNRWNIHFSIGQTF